MSRIPGTPDSIKRVNKLSLYKNKKKKYNLQLESHENNINNFLNGSKSNNLIELADLSQKDFTKFLQRLDGYNGLYTNSQLGNIDYSRFEEHVFFDSASSKVINAYQDIFNNYPYDQDYFKNIEFLSKIDGYTNYILENEFKKTYGQLKFDGNHKLVVKDQRGSLLKDHSDRKIGYLNPGKRKFSFNFWLLLKSDNTLATNNNQVIFKKFDSTGSSESGFICYLTKETNDYYINFLVVNKGIKYGKKCLLITQDDMTLQNSQTDNQKFKNINISVDNLNDIREISFLINGHDLKSIAISNVDSKLPLEDFSDKFKEKDTTLTIGHAESLSFNGITFKNLNNISIDEFRYYSTIKTQTFTVKNMHKNIFAQKGLLLYLKFNEPSGGHLNHSVTLDSSGNKLHGYIQDQNGTLSSSIRVNSTPMIHEKEMPVLFPSYTENLTRRNELIELADSYDKVNPNIIFKLFPKHYFIENSELEDISIYTNKSDYVSKEKGIEVFKANNSMMTNLLLVWARFFDSIKCYIDSISEVININYDTINENRNLGIILPLLCKRAGFDFREILPSPLLSKLDGRNLTFEDVKSENTIRQIQNILWKRILINSKKYLQLKGTRNSIKNIFHSFGLEFDKFVDIREFASTNKINSTDNYTSQEKSISSISFYNEDLRSTVATYTDSSLNSFSNNRPYMLLENLKYDLTSVYVSDDITKITSTKNGLPYEWSIEIAVSFNNLFRTSINNNQSIFRINKSNNDPILNLKASRDTNEKNEFDINLDFIAHVGLQNTVYNNLLTISDVNLFEGIKYINISQKKIEDNIYEISLLIQDVGNRNLGIVPKKSSIILNFNNNASFLDDSNISLCIGNFNYLDTVSSISGIGQITNTSFDGNLCSLRVWKRCLLSNEVKSHYLDLDNVGTNNLEIDKDLILDSKLKFNLESSDVTTSGGVQSTNIKNFRVYKKINSGSEDDPIYQDLNIMKLKANNTTSGFLLNTSKKVSYIAKKLSFKIDEPNAENRFNVVSYNDVINKDFNNNYNSFPSHYTPDDYDTVNDARVSIEISNSRFLNEDITKMMSSIEDFTSDIITTSNLYSYEYNKVKEKRNQYFKILDKEINNKTLINFFKYFDNALGNIINSSIPEKVGFLGFNYVYESHALERHKYEYKMSDSRVVVSDSNKTQFNREVDIGFRSRDYYNNRKLSNRPL